MNFRSPTEEPIYVGLTSGHTAVVGPTAAPLDQMFRREAIALGCLPDGVEVVTEDNKPSFDRKKIISEAMVAMLDGSNAEDFTQAGKPNLTRLNSRVGFTVPRDEADAIWDELSAKAP